MLKQTPGNPASHIANADKTQSRIFIGEQLIYLSIVVSNYRRYKKYRWQSQSVLLAVAWNYPVLLSLGSASSACRLSFWTFDWLVKTRGVFNSARSYMFIAENKRPTLRRSEERLDTTGFSHVVFQFSPSPREHTRNFKTPPTSVDKWSPGARRKLNHHATEESV